MTRTSGKGLLGAVLAAALAGMAAGCVPPSANRNPDAGTADSRQHKKYPKTASSEAKDQALDYQVPADQGAIYVWRGKDLEGWETAFRISVDGQKVGPLKPNNFFLVKLRPGPHVVKVDLNSEFRGHFSKELPVEVEAGRKHFVQTRLSLAKESVHEYKFWVEPLEAEEWAAKDFRFLSAFPAGFDPESFLDQDRKVAYQALEGDGPFWVYEWQTEDGATFLAERRVGGQPDGRAVVRYRNGMRWEGRFDEGVPTGKARLIREDGLVVNQIYKDGEVVNAFTEADVHIVNGDYQAAFELLERRSYYGLELEAAGSGEARLAAVLPRGPAYLAGVRRGDRLVAVDGRPLQGKAPREVVAELNRVAFGDTVRLEVARDGTTRTLAFVPAIVPEGYQGAPSTASLLWEQVRERDAVPAYRSYLDEVQDDTYKDRARRRMAALKAEQERAARRAERAGTVAAVIDFCADYPQSGHIKGLTAAVADDVAAAADPVGAYNALNRDCPAARAHWPARFDLLEVGPEELRVVDAMGLMAGGLGPNAVAAKIRSAGKPYKDFSAPEMQDLAGFGVPDEVIAAMVEATAAHKERMAQQERIEELEAENRRLRNSGGAPGTAAVGGGGPVAKENLPAQCLKLVASLQACDAAGGLWEGACRKIAWSKFDGCPVEEEDLPI
ncbi:MAG TPA: PDZ domain-containing protein [Gammaproteobacteria bacterium]|nr:PDZ domain-containing protein [Gammaproteobacteria bacterium]